MIYFYVIQNAQLVKNEIGEWYFKSSLPINRFFNTNGVLYREMSLKKIPLHI